MSTGPGSCLSNILCGVRTISVTPTMVGGAGGCGNGLH
ncbi:hypothetical protein [Azospirillum endophyticum]